MAKAKERKDDLVACRLCPWSGSRRLAHTHHIRPQGAGGSDDPANLATLCAGCHAKVHAIGYALLYRRASEAVDLLNANFSAPKHRALAKAMAEIAALEFAQNRESGGPEVHKVILEIPHDLFVVLQAAAKDKGVGVQKFLMAYIHRLHDRATVTSEPPPKLRSSRQRPKTIPGVQPTTRRSKLIDRVL